jgi:hypothetical protein
MLATRSRYDRNERRQPSDHRLGCRRDDAAFRDRDTSTADPNRADRLDGGIAGLEPNIVDAGRRGPRLIDLEGLC